MLLVDVADDLRNATWAFVFRSVRKVNEKQEARGQEAPREEARQQEAPARVGLADVVGEVFAGEG